VVGSHFTPAFSMFHEVKGWLPILGCSVVVYCTVYPPVLPFGTPSTVPCT